MASFAKLNNSTQLLEWYAKIHTSMKNISNTTVLLRYGQKSARRVDLVGDYAGKELFLLEGDSLLLKCFGGPQLDFDGSLRPPAKFRIWSSYRPANLLQGVFSFFTLCTQ